MKPTTPKTVIVRRLDWRAISTLSLVFAALQLATVITLSRPRPVNPPPKLADALVSIDINGHRFYAFTSMTHSSGCDECQAQKRASERKQP